MCHIVSCTSSSIKLLDSKPDCLLDFIPELTWNISSGFIICVPGDDMIKGIKYIGIVRKRKYNSSEESSDIDTFEKRRKRWFYIPVWGILNENDNGTWCHESQLTDLRITDSLFINCTAKYINRVNKIRRIVKYFTFDIKDPGKFLSSSDYDYHYNFGEGNSGSDEHIRSVSSIDQSYYEEQMDTEEKKDREEKVLRLNRIAGSQGMFFP